MREQIKIIDFKYKIVTWCFVFFFVISFFSPITGDDWNNYIVGSNGIIESFKNAIDMYFQWEGRVVSRFLMNVLTCSKSIYSILFASLMSTFVYECCSIVSNTKHKNYYYLPVLGLLLVNIFTFSQNYTWVSGCVTYTFPALITMIYFFYICRIGTRRFTKKEFVLLLLTNVIVPMFVEPIGVAFSLGNLLLLVYYRITKKKYSIPLIIFSIVSIMSLAIMLSSPGSIARIQSESLFYSLNIIDKLKVNLTNFISYSFSRNVLLLLLLLVPINYVMYQKWKDHTYYRLIAVLFNLIPLFNLFCNFSLMAPFNIQLVLNEYTGIFRVDHWYFILYWLLFLGLYIYSIIYIVKDKKIRNFLLLITIIGISSTACMLLLPGWNDRVSILWILAVIVGIYVLFYEMNLKVEFKAMHVVAVVLLLYYLVGMAATCYIDYVRRDKIEKQLEENKEVIEIVASPLYFVWNYNPRDEQTKTAFKKYYHIDEQKKIQVKYFGIFKEIEKTIKG